MRLSLHEQLKLLRLERKLSILELSAKTQLGIEKLTAYEAGEQIPSKQSLFILSTILEVPVSNLVDGLN